MQHLLVVGSTSAVAQAFLRMHAQRGACLTLVARSAERLAPVAADARVRGAAAVRELICDLTNPAAIGAALQQLDTPPNMALIAHGSLTDSAHAEQDLDYLARELTLNFTSACLWAQALASHMAAHGGGVLAVISSVAGDRGRGANHAYGAAKAGLTAFCSGLRARMLRRGVHVLTVKPGFIDTPMTAHLPKGPFWSTPEAVAKGIDRAMARRRDVVYLPPLWRPILSVIRHLPEPLFKRLTF
ncbi:MAG: SDR family oxidoreductase [Casimicrobiaceae bacterium]|nr:SDR family oxidoreductase [Casimicrobiaceae bacterium]MCX8097957.1 SDR family oxidoreductase [Casimicrobiaceae bacterium]MDW8313050.1 SDR family oxidoreductase [Burkholderiales bacterium]